MLDGDDAGELAGIRRLAYDGTEHAGRPRRRRHRRGHHARHRPRRLAALPAEGDHRGARQLRARRCAARSSSATACCTPSSATGRCPPIVGRGSAAARIRAIRVIGQGTAAVAGQSMAAVLDELCDGSSTSTPITATELCGFGMRLDMSDTLVVAISQSGTTTDTNRTVDLLRGRGRRGDRHRQPSQQRPHRQGRRRAVHVATGATWR